MLGSKALTRKDSIIGMHTIQPTLSSIPLIHLFAVFNFWTLASIVQCLEENFQNEIHAVKKLEVLTEHRLVLQNCTKFKGFRLLIKESGFGNSL